MYRHKDTQTENKWKGRSGNYMFIMGRENPDGMATGVVHKFAPDGVQHKLAGSFKILADGIITRFTGLSKADWNNMMSKAEAEYKTSIEETTATDNETAQEKVAV